MSSSEPLEVVISRVIPAEAWRVIRLLTKVNEFPTYMPNVKEVSVLERSRNRMKTRWVVQVDKVPISWTEEEVFSFDKGTISFQAVEGDLQEFKGEWSFAADPGGTKVTVRVLFKVGVPAIKEFADAYIKRMLTRNFEAILESMERRLISTRYASYKRGAVGKIAGFGIIGHLYNYNHLEACFKKLDPSARLPSREFLGQLFNLSPSFKMYDIENFRSKTGEVTDGCFVVATFIPDMIERDIWSIFSKVVRAIKIAEKNGVGIVTLGGFTSIVAERTGQEVSKEVDVPVTTGNTFTAAMTIDGVVKAAELLNLDIGKARAAIVGGTGDIGSGCARVLAARVKQLTVTGRTKANLNRLKAELAKIRKAKIIATTDNHAAVKDADIVITAASATASILDIDWFKPGAVICDVGYPKNVSYAPTKRRDILIFSGGLTKSPTAVALPIDVGLPAPDTLYGCFAEAIILALEKRYENYSFGRGNITPEKIDEIRTLGRRHGFEVSDFYWGHKLVDVAMVEKIKGVVNV